jgi:transketolase
MRDAFIDRLTKLAEVNNDVFLITADLGFGVLENFSKKFPNQFLNAGVSEQNMTGVATGLALDGYRVFTYSIANFATLRCLEQIRNDACYHDANVNVVSIGGGFGYGSLGMSHHATEDLSIMRAIPNIKVFAPGDDFEAAEATETAYVTNGPSYLRLERAPVNLQIDKKRSFNLGEANVLVDGTDLSVITSGGITEIAVEVAKELAEKNISIRVISMHTVKPIDEKAILQAVRETQCLITLEENNLIGGLGSAVSEVCMDYGVYPKSFKRLGLKDLFSSVVGTQNYLRSFYKIDKEILMKTIMQIIT